MLKDFFKYRTRVIINAVGYVLFILCLLFYAGYGIWYSLNQAELLKECWYIWLVWIAIAVTTVLIPPESGRKITKFLEFFEWDEHGNAPRDLMKLAGGARPVQMANLIIVDGIVQKNRWGSAGRRAGVGDYERADLVIEGKKVVKNLVYGNNPEAKPFPEGFIGQK